MQALVGPQQATAPEHSPPPPAGQGAAPSSRCWSHSLTMLQAKSASRGRTRDPAPMRLSAGVDAAPVGGAAAPPVAAALAAAVSARPVCCPRESGSRPQLAGGLGSPSLQPLLPPRWPGCFAAAESRLPRPEALPAARTKPRGCSELMWSSADDH